MLEYNGIYEVFYDLRIYKFKFVNNIVEGLNNFFVLKEVEGYG